MGVYKLLDWIHNKTSSYFISEALGPVKHLKNCEHLFDKEKNLLLYILPHQADDIMIFTSETVHAGEKIIHYIMRGKLVTYAHTPFFPACIFTDQL